MKYATFSLRGLNRRQLFEIVQSILLCKQTQEILQYAQRLVFTACDFSALRKDDIVSVNLIFLNSLRQNKIDLNKEILSHCAIWIFFSSYRSSVASVCSDYTRPTIRSTRSATGALQCPTHCFAHPVSKAVFSLALIFESRIHSLFAYFWELIS